jgi:hypothetical protein
VTTAAAESPVDELLAAAAIRERCRNIAAAVTAGRSRFFRIDRARLPAAAERVAEVTRRRYPALAIPYHSRWRHFDTGGVDRRGELERALEPNSPAERARAHIDLAVVSVLLDAGAGPAWGYIEAESGQRFTRSEGLGVASFRAFMQGAFSATPGKPLRVDATALSEIDAAKLARLLHASADNPLIGLDGRAALLRRTGTALTEQRAVFGCPARPGTLFDALTRDGQRDPVTLDGRRDTVAASAILRALLDGLNAIWLTGSTIDGSPVGDAWRHPQAGGSGPTAGWVPFHKLTQWLAYSLFEPFEWAGVAVTGRDELTGLPEYRNGGLLLDTGVLALASNADARIAWDVGSELVVEWRALTVTLLDELAPHVRARLGRADLPLACILEGGTWAAGRELALQWRGGDPPLVIKSDGTVF